MNNNQIIQLDDNTISLIAAGEVVESPASIVKELIENSIDANASNIVLEIRDGGKSYIRVTDDGIGIDESDVEIAFKRHTTSKITSFSDFCNLYTNGFRGEALASIAAVSKVSIITKTRDSFLGTSLIITGGIIEKKEKVGAKDGTTIIIEDLLYNTPARKSFLKSNQAETSKINDIVERLAIINKNIKFKFINNNKVMLTTTNNLTFTDSMNNIYNNLYNMSIKELPIEFVDDYGIEGFLGDNSIMAHNRKNQYVYINKRVVKSRLITLIVEEAYRQYITINRFPIFLINLNVDPALIDVNIHPNKLEVKFSNENKLKDILYNYIKSKLAESIMIPKSNLSSKYDKVKKNEPKNLNYVIDTIPTNEKTQTVDDTIINDKTHTENNIFVNENSISDYDLNSKSNNNKANLNNNCDSKYQFNYKDLSIIGVFINSYIITQYNETIYLIDQHAAHERILYEKYLNSYKNNKISSQNLLIPISINISFDISVYINDIINLLNDYGFLSEQFSQESLVIRAIPNIFNQNEALTLANELAYNFKKQPFFSDELKEKIASKACKAAIKANDKLLNIELSQILRDLDLCENKFSCPHGRPITVELSKYEIEKMFKRIV